MQSREKIRGKKIPFAHIPLPPSNRYFPNFPAVAKLPGKFFPQGLVAALSPIGPGENRKSQKEIPCGSLALARSEKGKKLFHFLALGEKETAIRTYTKATEALAF